MNRKRSKTRRWLLITGILVAVYTIAGFFLAPAILRGQLEKRAAEALGRPVSIERVRVNPFAISAAIEGLRVGDHDGGELASWRRAYANFDPLSSLFTLSWRFGEISLVGPRQRLVVQRDGRLNIADLLEGRPRPPAPGRARPAGMPAVRIGRLQVEDWVFAFSDISRRTAFQSAFGPMTFTLTGFSTAPEASSPYALAGKTDTGEAFGWSGSISVAPLGSRGRIEFRDVSVPKHNPFLEHLHGAQIRSGRMSLKTDYEVQLAGLTVLKLANAMVELSDLALGREGETEPAVALRALTVSMPAADLIARTAEVARVGIEGLALRAARRADGSVDLVTLLAPPGPDAGSGPVPGGRGTVDAGPAPSIRVAEVALSDARIALTDHTNLRPAGLILDQIAVTLTNAGTDLDREIGLDGRLRWAGDGSVALRGTVRLLPFAAALEVQGDALDLQSLDPFLEPFANVRLRRGNLRFAGHVEAGYDGGADRPTLKWRGDAGLDGLAVSEGSSEHELLTWKSLSFTGTSFTLEPLEFAASTVALVEPRIQLEVREDGTVNLAALRRAGPPSPAETTPPPAEAPAGPPMSWQARVDTVSVQGGRVLVLDRAFGPGFRTELSALGGTVRGLSSENLARADVELSGLLDGVAPLHIRGAINPLAEDKYSDLALTFHNIDLPVFSPYSARYIGQKIQKGKLKIDLAYRLSQRALEGENRVVLDQFYLGEKVSSPDAIKLPIGLALAVLRESDGRIPVDLPVRGSLDDPSFRLSGVIWQGVRNLFIKAATAPFALLGSAFGARKDQDLSYIEFASAADAPSGAEAEKVAVLARALAQRPALRLEIQAPAAPAGDAPGLRQLRLDALLAAERSQLTAGAETATRGAGESAVEEDLLVRRLFATRFPEQGAMGGSPAAGAAESAAVSAEQPAVKKPGLVMRSFSRLFGRRAAAEAPAPAPLPAPAAAPQEAPLNAGPTVEEMRQQLLASVQLEAADFADLARTRARLLRDRLLADGSVAPERIFLTDDARIPDGATVPDTGARVFFVLQ